jgi:hypothetical protein
MDYKALYEQSQKENAQLKKDNEDLREKMCNIIEAWQKDSGPGLRGGERRKELEADDHRIIPNFFTKKHIEDMSGESWSQEKFEALKDWAEDNLCEDVSDTMLEGIGYFEESYDDPDDWETMYGGSWDGTKYTVIMAGGSIDAWQYEIYPRHIMKVYPCQNRQERVNGCKLVANPEEREDQVKLVGINYTNKDGEEDFYDWLKDCGMLA